MGGKPKGSIAERELVSMLWGAGFGAVRVAGSGTSRFPCPDIVASNGSKIFAIECKACKERKRYIEAAQMNELLEFSKIFSAEPLVAVKVNNQGWHFLSPSDLETTEKGSYAINQKVLARAKKFIDISRKDVQVKLD